MNMQPLYEKIISEWTLPINIPDLVTGKEPEQQPSLQSDRGYVACEAEARAAGNALEAGDEPHFCDKYKLLRLHVN